MTQEFVTLPREVVEQALKAMEDAGVQRGSTGAEFNAIESLRAAMDQPQAEQPSMTPIAQRKLEDLMASGYTISGYSVYHEQKHQHGFVTGAGLVGWWKPDGVEYPQPRGEQEPAAEHELKDVRCECCGYMTHHREHMGCIRAAHTKREPLSDDDLCKVFPAIATYTESNKTLYRSIARAIEAAHNIK